MSEIIQIAVRRRKYTEDLPLRPDAGIAGEMQPAGFARVWKQISYSEAKYQPKSGQTVTVKTGWEAGLFLSFFFILIFGGSRLNRES